MFKAGMVCLVLGIAGLAFAQSAIEVTGVGAGGELHTAVFNPLNPDEILMGEDMCGVVISSSDGSQVHWSPYNENLINEDNQETSNVYEIHAIESNGTVQYVAATVGGLYTRWAGQTSWVAMTSTNHWYNDGSTGFDRAIPFCCIDDNGEGILVAGAGVNLHSRATDTEDDSNGVRLYPGLDGTISSPWGSTQYTVWIKEGAGATWQPYTYGSTECAFGAARDIIIRKVDGTNYIIVTTDSGIWMHDMGAGPWVNLADLDAYVYGVQRGPLRHYGCSEPYSGACGLHPWNLYLTARGTLYATLARKTPQPDYDSQAVIYAGLYKIHDLFNTTAREWHWVGNATALPRNDTVYTWNGSWSVLETLSLDVIGRGDLNWGAHTPLTYPIRLNVLEGTGADDDIVYLGCATSGSCGLLEGTVEYSPTVDSSTWRSLFYSQDGIPYQSTHEPMTEEEFGWSAMHGVRVNFNPDVYHDGSDLRLVVQAGVTPLYSEDGGTHWHQIQDQYDATWPGSRTLGYNEICVTGLDVDAGGNLVLSTGDCGLFEENDGGFFEYRDVRSCDGSDTWEDPCYDNAETGAVQVAANWEGSGYPATIVVAGEVSQGSTGSHKLLALEHDGTWIHVTAGLSSVITNIADLDLRIEDFIVVDGTTIYMAFETDSNYPTESRGVAIGAYATGGWTWTITTAGLSGDPNLSQLRDLEYFPEYGRLFLAANTGVWFYDLNNPTWINLCGSGAPELAPFKDVLCLARDTAGTRLYAGTQGGTGSEIGTVLKCTDPGSLRPFPGFTPMVNTTGTGRPFGFEQPAFYYPLDDPDQSLTAVHALAVKPGKPNQIAVGIMVTGYETHGFFSQCGVYMYGRNRNCPTWEELYVNTPYKGLPVAHLKFNNLDDDILHVGHAGYGAVNIDLGLVNPPGCGGGGDPQLWFRSQGTQVNTDGQAVFALRLEQSAEVSMKVYDVRGRLVSRTHYGVLAAGQHELAWNGRGQHGERVASGVYFARVTAGGAAASQRVVMIR